MKYLVALILCFALPLSASATVAFDAYSENIGSGDQSFTHTPVGTPRAVIIYTATGGSSDVTSVSYGGVALTQMTDSPNNHTTGEPQNITGWFLGTSIPTGAQTVLLDAGAATRIVYVVTLTGAADTEIVDVDATIKSDSRADPSVTLSLGGRSSFVSIAFGTGQDASTGTTPFSGWTVRDETDLGTTGLGYYTYDTVGTTDVTSGWTQTAEDAVAITAAVSEVQAASLTNSILALVRAFWLF